MDRVIYYVVNLLMVIRFVLANLLVHTYWKAYSCIHKGSNN